MENAIQNYSFENIDVTIIVENGEPLFCAKEVCDILGYKNQRDAIAKHTKSSGVMKRDLVKTLSNGRQQSFAMTFIDEANLYRLIMHSYLPNAEKFQDWVCGEVLPSVRKTGKYFKSQPQFQLPQSYSEALRQLASEVEQREALEAKNLVLENKAKEDAPKVDFCDQVVADNDAMTITKAAKVIGYAPRKFKDYIRQLGWLYSNGDTPMQKVIASGYMVLRYAHWTDAKGNAVEKPYAHITSKGLYALYKRMRGDGLIERAEQLELAA